MAHHNTALTLLDPCVAQVQEQFRPIPFIDHEGEPENHCADLMTINKDGRKIAVAVKPTDHLETVRFIRELEALKKRNPLVPLMKSGSLPKPAYRAQMRLTLLCTTDLPCDPTLKLRPASRTCCHLYEATFQNARRA